MTKSLSAIRMRINQIELINNSATSPLVAGDNAPIGSKYLGPSGIPWTKTGSTATSWTQDLLTQSYYNVVTYGATGDGATNDRVGIQAAITACIAAGGGTVYFPPGTYKCNAISGVVPVFDISGTASSNVTFLGCGMSSYLHLNGDGQLSDKVLFRIRNGAKYITFSNLGMKSTLTVGTEAEQQHLILIENASSSVDNDTGHMVIRDCYFGRVRGDAIRFLGNGVRRVTNVVCQRLFFQMVNPATQRSRSAFQFQRAVDDVTIDACYCTDDSSAIDMEPTGSGTNTRYRIVRNHFIGQVSLTGNGNEEHEQSIFADTTMVGSIEGLDIKRLILSGCIVDDQVVGTLGEGCIAFQERIQDVSICDNLCYRSGDANPISIISIAYHAVAENYNTLCDGNMAINACDVNDGGCVSMLDANNVLISNNLCSLAVNVTNKGTYIKVEGTTEAIVDASICGNMAIATDQLVKQGIVFGGGNTNIVDNVIRSVTDGVNIAGGAPVRTEQYMVARNALVSTVTGIKGNPDYVPVDGSGAVGPTIFQVIVDPEAVIPAVIGALALRTVGGAAATTLYVKTSGSSTAGWTAK